MSTTTAILVCRNCDNQVSPNGVFCSFCGLVQIRNEIIHQKSTANYDPGDKTIRPWRERNICAPNHWSKSIPTKSVNVKVQPWRPTGNVRLRIVKGLPSSVKDKIIQGLEKSISSDANKNRSDVYESDTLYRGKVWRKAGYKPKGRKLGVANVLIASEVIFSGTCIYT